MKARVFASGLSLMIPLLWTATAMAAESAGRLTVPQSNYLLGCGGCHGVDGISNSKLVPDLRDQVGYFLNSQAGREYLVRVPNVAFYAVSDQSLTDMLNFMIFQLGRASTPAGAKPYTKGEVARLRKQPLTEISLVDFRAQLIGTLSAQYEAPRGIRVYGSEYSQNE
jgi:mono/diheme cytochrome c family protein